MSTTTFSIVDGGSWGELMPQPSDIARLQALSYSDWPTFRLVIQHPTLAGKLGKFELKTRIPGYYPEDGSGFSWMIMGDVMNFGDMPQWLKNAFLSERTGHYVSRFAAYYDTRIRKGTLIPRQTLAVTDN